MKNLLILIPFLIFALFGCGEPCHDSHIQLQSLNKKATVTVMEDGCFKIEGDAVEGSNMIKYYLNKEL